MNFLAGSNGLLRDAILEGNVEKARKYLTLKIGKADVEGLTEVCILVVSILIKIRDEICVNRVADSQCCIVQH